MYPLIIVFPFRSRPTKLYPLLDLFTIPGRPTKLYPLIQLYSLSVVHRKKKVREFPVPSQDVTTKLSLGGNNDVISELFLPRGILVSDIPAGDGKLENLFLWCRPTKLYPLLVVFPIP